MDINYIRTFLAVVTHRNFAKAGKTLGLSRSAVSLQINALENEFEVRLFDRSRRPPVLTLEGQSFVQKAREILVLWSRLGNHVEPDKPVKLVIGAVQTVVAGILPHALEALHRHSPDTRIKLVTGLADELDAMLRRGELDVVIQPQSDNIHPGLVWQPVCQEPLMVVASRSLEGETDVELLGKLPFIRFRRIAWGLGRTIEQEFTRRRIEVQTLGEVDSIEAVLSLVQHNLGVSIVPYRRMRDPFPSDVRTVPFGTPPLSRTIGVLWREDQKQLQSVQVLYHTLIQASESFGPTPAS